MEEGNKATFSDNKCIIQKQCTGKEKGKDRRTGCLFTFGKAQTTNWEFLLLADNFNKY